MPAAGLMTAGLIGAGGSLASGLMNMFTGNRAGRYLNATGQNIAQSINKATGQAIDAGYAGMGEGSTALQNQLANASGAAASNYGAGNAAVGQAVGGANQALQNAYGQQLGFLSPYMAQGQQGMNTLGQLQSLLAPGGQLSTPFNASLMEANDPGYQFRLQQGELAQQRSANAAGGAMGGAEAKALDRYSQDYASNEYQNAFNRYMAGNQQTYNMLSGLAGTQLGVGQNATNMATQAAGNLGYGTSANTMQGGQLTNQNFANLANFLGTANMNTGNLLNQDYMQGNQYVGNVGMSGAQAAGNAYWNGALGGAGGAMAGSSALGQGLSGMGQGLGLAAIGYNMSQPTFQPNYGNLSTGSYGYGGNNWNNPINLGGVGPTPPFVGNSYGGYGSGDWGGL